MNNICGSSIHSKLQELISLPSSITPEVLNKLCDDDLVQPFLNWFYNNISSDNVLSDRCIQLKEHVQKTEVWLQGSELDAALVEATKDCPELLKLIDSEYWDSNQSFVDFTTEEELYEADFEYLKSIEDSLKKLEECEEHVDNNLDKEADAVEREKVKMKLIYENSTSVLEEFDKCHRQFSNDVEILANLYVNVIEKKEEPCFWIQMPIELYTKQLETYNNYLILYAKRQFSKSQLDENEDNVDHASFVSESDETESLRELMCCQKNLFTSKMREIITKVEEDESKSLVNFLIEIYNNGNLKAPSTSVMARAEIADLTKKRDFLEQNINHLHEHQLVNTVEKYAKAKVIKVLEEEAEARLARRRHRLLSLEKLCALAKEHGHAFATLLCMLLELQIHRINEIVQFVIDARHYLSKEYNLTLIRNENMQKLQDEYDSIMSSPKMKNAFSRIFMEMTTIDNLQDNFDLSVSYFDDLKNDNNSYLKILLDEKLLEMIESSESLEKEVMKYYNEEIGNNPTLSFKAIPYHVENNMDETREKIKRLEENIEVIRNKLKTIIKETSVPNFEREKLLIWQKFLADPVSLKNRYEELEDLRNRTIY